MLKMAGPSIWLGLMAVLVLLHRHNASAEQLHSISQISPKSDTLPMPKELPNHTSISHLHTDPIVEASASLRHPYDLDSAAQQPDHQTESESIESDSHMRRQRSASPAALIHDDLLASKSSYQNLEHVDTNEVEPSEGRYFNYIRPTTTAETASIEPVPADLTLVQSQRTGKDLSIDPFLSNGGPRPISSGSPSAQVQIQPTSATSENTQVAPTSANHPRQNPNPDIQDIITGIVKLLNGNVNIHTNSQLPSRKPYPSRINNRGPPRISEAQPLPNDFDQVPPPLSTHRPQPPYPFDRPDGPSQNRPFLNGVPLPEQVVPPSMQQNYRPGFISQNRPPWQRPRPRPPITGNRRPIPPYKPAPTMPEYRPEDDPTLTTLELEGNDSPAPTDPNFDLNGYEVEEPHTEDIESTSVEILAASTTSKVPPKKEEFTKKKDKTKSSEKKTISPTSSVSEETSATVTEVTESIIETTTEFVYIEPTITTTVTTESVASSSIESSFVSSDTISSPTSTSTPALESKPTILPTATTTRHIPNVPAPTSITRQPAPQSPQSGDPNYPYHPRPGIVLDDPEFKPGGIGRHPPQQRPQQIQPTRPVTPPGYGEIFDVTLSAIQGPSGSGSKHTIKINPYDQGSMPGGNGDIIVSPNGDDGFVSIDGKRTYLNLFGESTESDTLAATPSTVQRQPIIPTSAAHASTSIKASQQVLPPGVTGTGYAVVETEQPPSRPAATHSGGHAVQGQLPGQRPNYRPRPTLPPVRIDTCIVGDDSTCDQAQNEKCKTEAGVSSCHCRPGYSRRKHREPCRRVVSFLMSLRVDKFYERRIVWDKLLADKNSEPYGQLSYEAIRAIDSAMSMTPFSDEFMDARVNKIYNGNASQGAAGVFVNITLQLEENGDTLRTNVKQEIQKQLLGVLHRRNNNIGNSVLYVESSAGAVSNLQDVDECSASDLNDCHPAATCTNIWGSFHCECPSGLRDPWSDQPQRAGRECHSCPATFCNNRGTCAYDNGNQVCSCDGNYYGAQCEIDGEVLGVAIGASVTAVIIIVLTLICLVMWSRRWQREQKNAMGSPVFGYMAGAQVKTPGVGPAPYQVTLEDRMRWAQIADVMAQSNHYGTDPVGSTRPSSAMFGYPNLQMMNTMGTMGGNMGTMSMVGTLPMHHSGTLPPIPLPRQNLNYGRSSGMRTLENSSSSEEEDRTDLLGRHFQVPRPKSRSNGSIASGIYYDVDYAPSGGGLEQLYGGTQTTTASTPMSGSHQQPGIPMSTYGRVPSTYYK